MAKNKVNPVRKPFSNGVKLVTAKKLAIMILAIVVGVGWYAYRYYRQKGRIDGVLIFSAVTSLVIGIAIVAIMAWWANRPERKD